MKEQLALETVVEDTGLALWPPHIILVDDPGYTKEEWGPWMMATLRQRWNFLAKGPKELPRVIEPEEETYVSRKARYKELQRRNDGGPVDHHGFYTQWDMAEDSCKGVVAE